MVGTIYSTKRRHAAVQRSNEAAEACTGWAAIQPRRDERAVDSSSIQTSYSFDASSPKKAAHASKLIRSAIETRAGIVSYQVVQEFFNIALCRFSKSMSSIEAEQYMSTTFRPLLSVHSSQGLYGETLRIGARFQLPWYDSLIMASAIEGQCVVLYSEDFQDGHQIGGITISNSFA